MFGYKVQYTGKPIELFEKDDLVGVLIARDHSFGWSTMNECIQLAYDKRIIDFWFQVRNNEKFMQDIRSIKDNETQTMFWKLLESWGYGDVNIMGFHNLQLVWVPKGQPFIIREYDGKEYVEYCGNVQWMVF